MSKQHENEQSAPAEAWSMWSEAVRAWLTHPAALNPFAGLPGVMPAMTGPGADASASSAGSWLAKEWLKLTDPEAIGKRIEEMRVVEAWLSMTLAGVQATIKTLELQRAAYAALRPRSEPSPAPAPSTTQGSHRPAEPAPHSSAPSPSASAASIRPRTTATAGAPAAQQRATRPLARKAARRRSP
ncbi:MAG: hypothetical protein N3F11_10870 [Casimicrobiaceae bacterium]|nr:hypothetical protein [Casimicrobiaceae bacterium]